MSLVKVTVHIWEGIELNIVYIVEHGKLPQQPRKNKPDNWTPADSSDEEMIDVDSDDEEEEDEDQENYEEDGQNVIKVRLYYYKIQLQQIQSSTVVASSDKVKNQI